MYKSLGSGIFFLIEAYFQCGVVTELKKLNINKKGN